jgi:hypothetical protein
MGGNGIRRGVDNATVNDWCSGFALHLQVVASLYERSRISEASWISKNLEIEELILRFLYHILLFR